MQAAATVKIRYVSFLINQVGLHALAFLDQVNRLSILVFYTRNLHIDNSAGRCGLVDSSRDLHQRNTSKTILINQDAAVNGRRFARMNKGKIMRKLLGQHTTTTNESIEPNPLDPPQLRPSASQNKVFKTGSAIACLDRSPDGQRAVIAGPKIFKTLRIDGSTITEELDLRTIISSYAASHDVTAATADQFNIRAVRWLHTELDTTIITACAYGRMTLYDLNRAGEGLKVARIHEHNQQVHKIDINPFRSNWVLSASQDGTVKSFDLRSPVQGRSGATFRSWHTFKCNADAVRDVKWSPTDGFHFACCTDAGLVQKWDARRPGAPILKITAHQKACISIAWHPDGDHLVSGGIDQLCHVWDLSKTADRSQKPRYSITTPAPISSVSWRPACWSATAKGKRAAQVTVLYDDTNTNRHQLSTVHLWDLARPTMPFKEIEHWESSPTGTLWNTRDLFWSVDRNGSFTQTDVAFVPQFIERRSLSTFAFAPTGDVLMLLEPRQPPRRSRPSISSPEISPSYHHSPNGPLLSVSRSDSEEDVVGSFLGPRLRKRRHQGDRTISLSTTPPSITGMADNNVMSLDDAVNVTGIYKPLQVMAIGRAPSTAKKSLYKYFSNKYLGRMIKDTTNCARPTNVRLAMTMEYFAQAAESIAQYRLAQTWRILGYTMNLLLTKRAEYHRQDRLAVKIPLVQDVSPQDRQGSPKWKSRGEETPRKIPRPYSPYSSPLHPTSRAAMMEDIESTSNVATPLVRPVQDIIEHKTREAMQTSLVEDDELQLPGPAHGASATPLFAPGSNNSSDYTASSVEGYDFYGMESFSPSVDFVAPPRKHPLRLDYSESTEVVRRMQPQRHDSGESFQMFSTSAESGQGKFMSSSESDSHSQAMGSSLKDRVSIWENGHRDSIDSDAPGHSESSDEPFTSSTMIPISHRVPRNAMPRDVASPPVFRIQEASAPKALETQLVKTPVGDEPISPSERTSQDPEIIEADFLPWSTDPGFMVPALDPEILVQRSITFEAQTGSLNASAMILLLRPFLPPDAIDAFQAEAILAQYHQRLIDMKLFTEAALLRNLCVPFYPNVFSAAQGNVTIGFFCRDCYKPLENDPLLPNSQWRCPRCQQSISGCAICLQRDIVDVEYDDADTVDSMLWWYCPGCGHGGHTTCMAAWHAGAENEEGTKHSGGCCPLEGCLHPCLPGTWRELKWEENKAAKQKEMDMLVKESSRQGSGRSRGVRRDVREVNQSKAVEGVRVALGIGGLERKKSVKVVAPGEESKGP